MKKQWLSSFNMGPDKLQMLFGDGGKIFQHFTGCIDIIGHDVAHAIQDAA